MIDLFDDDIQYNFLDIEDEEGAKKAVQKAVKLKQFTIVNMNLDFEDYELVVKTTLN